MPRTKAWAVFTHPHRGLMVPPNPFYPIPHSLSYSSLYILYLKYLRHHLKEPPTHPYPPLGAPAPGGPQNYGHEDPPFSCPSKQMELLSDSVPDSEFKGAHPYQIK